MFISNSLTDSFTRMAASKTRILLKLKSDFKISKQVLWLWGNFKKVRIMGTDKLAYQQCALYRQILAVIVKWNRLGISRPEVLRASVTGCVIYHISYRDRRISWLGFHSYFPNFYWQGEESLNVNRIFLTAI